MRIQLLNGGLGNQAFQYIFVRFAERYAPEETWWIDDSAFFISNAHNGYELEKVFGVKPNLLSNYFDTDVWDEIIRLRKDGVSLPQIFSDMGLPITLVAETSDYSFQGDVAITRANEFHPEITVYPAENVYYHGYWINKKWFSTYREENLAEFTFPPLTDERNVKYAAAIQATPSIGIHIRRGDFVTLGWTLPVEYYNNGCKAIVEKFPDAWFFVFTDDVDWCKANAEGLGLNLSKQTIYVSGNMHGKNYIDMQLLSMCRGIIMSNSSFCYLAALLDQNLKVWINPTSREV